MSSKKFLPMTLNTISALTLSGVLLGMTPNASVWAMEPEDSDSLFPTTSPGLTQIKAGWELVKKFDAQNSSTTNSLETEQKIVKCNTNFTDPTFKDKSFLPDNIVLPENYNKRCDPFTRNYLGLCVGYGSAKIALKLDRKSPTIALIGPNKVTARKESEAYKIFNAFGLISQQNPEIVTVKFNNGATFKDVLAVASFDSLTQETKHRRTWDTKNFKAFGDISFFNGQENYANIDYHCRLLFPLVRDLTLWHLIGAPGNNMDSPNLIFKQTKKNEQTICRLFLYDIYPKGTTEDTDMFEKLKSDYNKIKCTNKIKNNISSSVSYRTKILYNNIYQAMTVKEKTELWGGLESTWDSYSFPINEEDLESNWQKLEPLILQESTNEVARLVPLFNELK